MKNFSDEQNNLEKNIKIFPQDKKISLDNKKPVIITESLQIKNNSIENYTENDIIFSKKYKIIFIIAYYIIIIWVETFYRNFLFQISIPIQEKIQKNSNNIFLLNLAKILSIFGAEISTLLLFSIIFLFMPLNYSFLILQSIVYSAYFTNTFKMIYQSDRPNWHSNYLTYSCNYGYGNPSGHSFTSISLYLSLSHLLVHYFKINGILKILIFILLICFALLIAMSRFILAAHSLNQIFFGITLGLGLYFILIHILGYHKYSSVDFLQYIKRKTINYFYYFLHFALLIFTILVYILINSKDNSDVEKNVFNGVRCKIKKSYEKYKNDGLFQSLSITSIIGSQLGINILIHVLKYQNYLIGISLIEWNKSKNIKNYILKIPIIFTSSIFILLYFIIPKDWPLLFIFILKSGVPFFLGMFGIHFIGIYICIYLKVANSEIYKMDVLHEITSS
jgi:hypothetical protein